MEKSLTIIFSAEESEFAERCKLELTKNGSNVISVSRDGKEVIKSAQENNADVVIMDAFMVHYDAIAVISNNVKLLTQIPGIGTKSAQRIILELKDKLKADQNDEQIEQSKLKSAKVNETVQEAISGLMVLGYSRKDIEKAFEHLAVETLSVEDLIKKGLILLSK